MCAGPAIQAEPLNGLGFSLLLSFFEEKERRSTNRGEMERRKRDAMYCVSTVVLSFLCARIARGDRISMRDEDVSHSGKPETRN